MKILENEILIFLQYPIPGGPIEKKGVSAKSLAPLPLKILEPKKNLTSPSSAEGTQVRERPQLAQLKLPRRHSAAATIDYNKDKPEEHKPLTLPRLRSDEVRL